MKQAAKETMNEAKWSVIKKGPTHTYHGLDAKDLKPFKEVAIHMIMN